MCFVAAEIMAYNAPSFISTKDQTGTRHCFFETSGTFQYTCIP